MILPKLKVIQTSRQTVDTFKGYNHNLRIGDGEFFNMKNMTGDCYPILSPRNKRGVYVQGENPQGLIAKDALCYVDGSCFVMGDSRIDMRLSTEEQDCPKRLVSMGVYVIILPDKKYINTADLTDFGNIEAVVTTKEPVSFTLSRADGGEYPVKYTQDQEPQSPENMDLWVDTASTPNALKQWSASAGMWVSIATTYIRIESEGIGKTFEKYDGIAISGLSGSLHDENWNVLEDTGPLAALEGAAIVWDKGDDYIVVVGMLEKVLTISDPITVSRTMPVMDFVIEHENRLWGCRYGTGEDGKTVNEIYASKLGDFKNWKCFMNLSTDSYAVTVGTDGQFTGAITHMGHPLFFKEGCLHKVYGTVPSNFQVQTTPCRGVQKGCERSLAIVNETLFYKAAGGVCAYDGSLPSEVSYALGNEAYGNAVGGAAGNKYYISMEDARGQFHLFLYDTAKGMWHREDNLRADGFCAWGGEMYCIDHDSRKILALLGSGMPAEKMVTWMAETGEMGLGSADMKYISRVTIRMSLDIGAEIRIFARYDGDEQWVLLFATRGTSLRSFSIPVRPRRCDYMKLRFEGEGMARIYAITETIEGGSDLS